MFYNFEYYSQNLLEILKIWKGGMSFHGALIGIILGTSIFANKKKLRAFVFLDLVACTAPIGIFLEEYQISSMVSYTENQLEVHGV